MQGAPQADAHTEQEESSSLTLYLPSPVSLRRQDLIREGQRPLQLGTTATLRKEDPPAARTVSQGPVAPPPRFGDAKTQQPPAFKQPSTVTPRYESSHTEPSAHPAYHCEGFRVSPANELRRWSWQSRDTRLRGRVAQTSTRVQGTGMGLRQRHQQGGWELGPRLPPGRPGNLWIQGVPHSGGLYTVQGAASPGRSSALGPPNKSGETLRVKLSPS